MRISAEETKRLARPVDTRLGITVWLMAVFIDAWAEHNWGTWETALLSTSDRSEGWNEAETKRTLRLWGAKDQYGLYDAAGLTKRQAEVAFLHFDRQLTSVEIGELVGCDAVTARVHLHDAKTRLRKLAEAI